MSGLACARKVLPEPWEVNPGRGGTPALGTGGVRGQTASGLFPDAVQRRASEARSRASLSMERDPNGNPSVLASQFRVARGW
jgi:hypothetical protein